MKKLSQDQIFHRFAPYIRSFIYNNGWEELREIQCMAAHILFETEDNLLITSPTASGKTEAALFPILSMLEHRHFNSVDILYIAPLKSLINDQFSRLDALLFESGVPVFHWHGDVSAGSKEKFLKNPRGILQITTESLESMLLHRSNDIPRIFAHLSYIIIDEIHAFTGQDRGEQTRCIMERIARLVGHCPRRIGLSASGGNTRAVADWLGQGTPYETSVAEVKNATLKWRLAMQHFFADEPEKEGDLILDSAYAFVYAATEKKKCLVFSNSREETELVTATLRQIARKKGDNDRFMIHHGNLSAAIREEAEYALREENTSPMTACATVTLELGIDIGRLQRIVNMGAPNTAVNFLQRLGRSGRRDVPPEMMLVFREEKALPNAPLYQLVPWELIQAIAIIQLYLEERFLEESKQREMPMSLLFHQTLATLASGGEMAPASLADRVLSLSPFTKISPRDYKALLIHLLETDILEKGEEGGILTGMTAERILGDYRFYAVFKDSEDFTVREKSEEIGTITTPPPIGDRFALAGRVWEVEEVDASRKLIYVKRVEGKMEIAWPGDRGEIHTRVLERMRQVLLEDTVYPYLKPSAAARLTQARALARQTGFAKHPLVCLGGNRYCLFPWLGTRAIRTLKRLLVYFAQELDITDIQYDACYYISFRTGQKDILQKLAVCLTKDSLPLKESLLGISECPIQDKYDPYIPPALLKKAYAKDKLDYTDILRRSAEWK